MGALNHFWQARCTRRREYSGREIGRYCVQSCVQCLHLWTMKEVVKRSVAYFKPSVTCVLGQDVLP
jgi:hypothetical protein